MFRGRLTAFRRWLSQFDWAAIIGSALVLAFLMLVFFPGIGSLDAQHKEQQHCYATAKNTSDYSEVPCETFWVRTTNDPVALYTLCLATFTFVLAASTILLWRSTYRLWEAGERHIAQTQRLADRAADQLERMTEAIAATNRLADKTNDLVTEGTLQTIEMRNLAQAASSSAQTAERALIDLERPFVHAFAEEIITQWLPNTYGGPPTPVPLDLPTVELQLLNFGRTPASLLRLEYAFLSVTRGKSPPQIDPKIVGGRSLPVGTTSAAGYPHSERTNLRAFGQLFQVEEEIKLRRCSIWLIGFVRYRDIFKSSYITGFAQVYDPVGGRFVARGDESYNYARAENPADIPAPSSDK